ncbi:hypothetical protein GQ671_03620 [Salinicoccus hispanicus]|uniref:Uncharacterized protein n=1 Tax=Salinicoccus hispanicus TaxID=157225 RepID=A0A6N8TWU3_9STAP|nr:hypothetical protein [Salinicoccus hispanicus]
MSLYQPSSRQNSGGDCQSICLCKSKSIKTKLFKDINRGINEVACVKRHIQLIQKHFNLVIDFINEWLPQPQHA